MVLIGQRIVKPIFIIPIIYLFKKRSNLIKTNYIFLLRHQIMISLHHEIANNNIKHTPPNWLMANYLFTKLTNTHTHTHIYMHTCVFCIWRWSTHFVLTSQMYLRIHWHIHKSMADLLSIIAFDCFCCGCVFLFAEDANAAPINKEQTKQASKPNGKFA